MKNKKILIQKISQIFLQKYINNPFILLNLILISYSIAQNQKSIIQDKFTLSE